MRLMNSIVRMLILAVLSVEIRLAAKLEDLICVEIEKDNSRPKFYVIDRSTGIEHPDEMIYCRLSEDSSQIIFERLDVINMMTMIQICQKPLHSNWNDEFNRAEISPTMWKKDNSEPLSLGSFDPVSVGSVSGGRKIIYLKDTYYIKINDEKETILTTMPFFDFSRIDPKAKYIFDYQDDLMTKNGNEIDYFLTHDSLNENQMVVFMKTYPYTEYAILQRLEQLPDDDCFINMENGDETLPNIIKEDLIENLDRPTECTYQIAYNEMGYKIFDPKCVPNSSPVDSEEITLGKCVHKINFYSENSNCYTLRKLQCIFCRKNFY